MAVYSTGKMNKSLTVPLVMAILAAAIGSSFQFGFLIGSINTPATVIQQWINETYMERHGEYMPESQLSILWGVVVSISALGGAIGAGMTSLVSQRIGRRNGLIINNVTAIAAGALAGLSKPWKMYELIIASRLLLGVNSGLNSGLAPMYLTEISPLSMRGAVGTIFQLFVTIGILASQIMGLHSLLGNAEWWYYLLAFPILPALLQLVVLPACPKSPRYLYLTRKDTAGARKALERLRDGEDVSDEINELAQEVESVEREPKVSVFDLFRSPVLRSVTLIALMLMVTQQFSGINIVMFYSNQIFEDAGLASAAATWATIGMGSVNVAMTIVSMAIVDRAGRRSLLLIGYCGMCVVTALLAVTLIFQPVISWLAYGSVALVYIFVILFATGPGSIPWFIVTEIFTQGPRSAATTIAVLTNWVCTGVIGLAFPPLVKITGHFTFFVFTSILVGIVFFVWQFVPETRGKPIDEIQRELNARYGNAKYSVNVSPGSIEASRSNVAIISAERVKPHNSDEISAAGLRGSGDQPNGKNAVDA